ncbi:UDP-glucose--LPS alpha 1,3-glucosyltransferase WaaG [Methylophaga sp. 41_12_T18]|nr:UDP-glucose--LPS alpha 1,3-glucosyltransferase WaaG [Methylophaga sp. 41_12_T18]
MKLAVCLYKYFPFGGLARDFLNIMSICRDRGYQIDVYVMEWQGDIPDGFNVHVIPVKAWTNHGKVKRFIDTISPQLKSGNYDLIVGFNKIPGLDVYYAADPCYLDRVKNQKNSFLYRLGARFRFYAHCEQAVFGADSNTVSLMISDVQRGLFKLNYDTADERLLMLPPGISVDRKRPQNWQTIRADVRASLAINDNEFILMMVGTAFKTKGVDRSIAALASLPPTLRDIARLVIVGDGDSKSYLEQANKLDVKDKVEFLGGRKDIPQLLLAADLLLHPARKENTGTVILEAMVAGLPMIVSQACGYAKHVTKSSAGAVVDEPFNQLDFNRKLVATMQDGSLPTWSDNGLAYAKTEDLYSMPIKAADIIEQQLQQRKTT